MTKAPSCVLLPPLLLLAGCGSPRPSSPEVGIRNEITTSPLAELHGSLGRKSAGLFPATPLPDALAGVDPGKDGTIRLIKPSVAKGEQPTAAVRAAFLPGGTQIVLAGGPVVVRDLPTDKAVRRVGEMRVPRASALALSRDGGKVLIPSNYDYTLRLCDVATGKDIRRFATAPSEDTVSMALSPSGQWAVSASRGSRNDVHLWKVETGERVRRYEVKYSLAYAVAISPDEKLVAASWGALQGGKGVADTCGVWVWELATGREVAHLPSHEDLMLSAAFSPDGRYLAAGGADGIIRLWETGSWKEVRQLTGHPGTVAALAFAPDSKVLASGGARDQARRPGTLDGSVRVWQVATGKLLHTLEGHQWAVASVDFSPDGRYVVSGGDFPDGTVRVWRLPEGPADAKRAEGEGPEKVMAAAQLGKEYAADEAGADRKYKGRALTLTGKVLEVGRHGDGRTMIYLEGATRREAVLCLLKPEQGERGAAGLRPGQAVNITGRCTGRCYPVNVGSAVVEECQVLP